MNVADGSLALEEEATTEMTETIEENKTEDTVIIDVDQT